MAQEKIALGINLRKNKIPNSVAYGKYYPEVDLQKTLSLRGFAEHMTAHGAKYRRAEVEGVLQQITECLPELLAQGVPVQLGSLGTFYPSAEVMPKTGAVLNIGAMDGLDPNTIIKGIHIRFTPDQTKLDNLCSPTFKYACQLELRNIVDTVKVTVNGKEKTMQTLKPIATAVAEWKAEHGESTSGGETTGGETTGGETTGGNDQGNDGPPPEGGGFGG